MRRSVPHPAALALVCAGVAGACVPRGAPPTGRQIVADRTSVPVAFAAPTSDGITRLLFTRQGQDGSSTDLHVIGVDASGEPAGEQLLASNVVDLTDGSDGYRDGDCSGIDGRGRLLIVTAGSANPQGTLARIDPVTGARWDLGPAVECHRSASGQQLLVLSRDGATLYDANDQATSLDAGDSGFIGEDLYYVTRQQQLVRRSADGATTTLATAVNTFTVEPPASAPALLLRRTTPDMSTTTFAMLDVSTGQETPLALALQQSFTVSPDGRWFLLTNFQTGALAFLDWKTGEQRPIDVASGARGGPSFWRPGHDEVWFMSSQPWQAVTSVRTPEGGAADYPLWPVSLYAVDSDDDESPIFTTDGRYLFSSPPTSSAGQTGSPQVGSADDPDAPRFDLVPAGSEASEYRQLADGRLLIAAWTWSPDETNLYAVDPTTGTRTALGQQGQLLAVGQSRLLVNQHLVDYAGDLTVIDLATGSSTVLANEFALAAAVQPTGADDVAPGAPIAFRFEARFPSPYDGIWLTTVP